MTAIASINAQQAGAFAAAPSTLTSDDTITFDPKKKQLLLLRNPTGGTLTANIKGTGVVAVAVPGIGSVDVTAGLNIALLTTEVKAVVLSSINKYLPGVVHITGAAGVLATVFDL